MTARTSPSSSTRIPHIPAAFPPWLGNQGSEGCLAPARNPVPGARGWDREGFLGFRFGYGMHVCARVCVWNPFYLGVETTHVLPLLSVLRWGSDTISYRINIVTRLIMTHFLIRFISRLWDKMVLSCTFPCDWGGTAMSRSPGNVDIVYLIKDSW